MIVLLVLVLTVPISGCSGNADAPTLSGVVWAAGIVWAGGIVWAVEKFKKKEKKT